MSWQKIWLIKKVRVREPCVSVVTESLFCCGSGGGFCRCEATLLHPPHTVTTTVTPERRSLWLGHEWSCMVHRLWCNHADPLYHCVVVNWSSSAGMFGLCVCVCVSDQINSLQIYGGKPACARMQKHGCMRWSNRTFRFSSLFLSLSAWPVCLFASTLFFIPVLVPVNHMCCGWCLLSAFNVH